MQSHIIMYAGQTLYAPDANGAHVYALQYGSLRSVYASEACNYSYREFWF